MVFAKFTQMSHQHLNFPCICTINDTFPSAISVDKGHTLTNACCHVNCHPKMPLILPIRVFLPFLQWSPCKPTVVLTSDQLPSLFSIAATGGCTELQDFGGTCGNGARLCKAKIGSQLSFTGKFQKSSGKEGRGRRGGWEIMVVEEEERRFLFSKSYSLPGLVRAVPWTD